MGQYVHSYIPSPIKSYIIHRYIGSFIESVKKVTHVGRRRATRSSQVTKVTGRYHSSFIDSTKFKYER